MLASPWSPVSRSIMNPLNSSSTSVHPCRTPLVATVKNEHFLFSPIYFGLPPPFGLHACSASTLPRPPTPFLTSTLAQPQLFFSFPPPTGLPSLLASTLAHLRPAMYISTRVFTLLPSARTQPWAYWCRSPSPQT